MTPSALKSLLRNSLLLLALLSFSSAFSQLPDTVVVYEYVYKTDTIWLEPISTRDTLIIEKLESIEEASLLIDTISNKASLQFFSSGASATIPIKGIIYHVNQKQPEMKKITFLGLTLLAITTVNAQNKFNDHFGFYVKGNAVTQIFKKYNDTDKYYTAESIRPSPGFGVKYEHNMNKTFSVVGNLGYLQRGCYQPSYSSYFSLNGGPWEEKIIPKKVNRFHNINLDALLKISFRKNKVINPYLYTGLRGDLTFAKSIEYEIGHPNPNDNSYSGFNAFNFGTVNGFGVDFNKRISLEFELNNDLGFLLKNDILRVKNLMGSINLCYYFDKIPNKKRVKLE
jgi:hypothetical protein